jgi:hypothetical protein
VECIAIVGINDLTLEFEPSFGEKASEVVVASELQQAKQEVENQIPTKSLKETIKSVLGWVSVVSIALAIVLEPSKPKRDRRFKTGYKNNARAPSKSANTIRTQISAVTIGAISFVLWYLPFWNNW